MRLLIALLALFLPISLSQRWYTHPYPRTCTGRQGMSNCVAPRICRTGHYENTEMYNRHPSQFCCYDSYFFYVGQGEWSLDCRKRNRSNLARTDTSSNVVDLDLSSNDFANYSTRLRDDFLQNFVNLKTLRIEMSHLNTLPSDFLSAHAKLEKALFAWNDIRELPEDLFANNPKLYDVSFRNNKITSIPERLFRNNPELWRLQISGNSLTRLSQASLQYLPNLSVFEASNNEGLQCMSSNLFRHNENLKLVRLNNIGRIIPKNVQRFYCDGAYCPYSMTHLKTIMRLYQSLYQCPDERGRYSRGRFSP